MAYQQYAAQPQNLVSDIDKTKSIWFLAVSIILLVFSFVLSLGVGTVATSLFDVLAAIFHMLRLPWMLSIEQQPLFIIENLRMPRSLLTILVGAGLAVSGAAIQSLFRNPLADPGLIGVSSGAALGAVLLIAVGQYTFVNILTWLGWFMIPVAAFVGGLWTTLLVAKLGQSAYGISISAMLLAGIAINAIAGSLIGLFSYITDDVTLRYIVFWMLGSFASSQWQDVIIVGVLVLTSLILLIGHARSLNALLLGEKEAMHLGIRVEVVKRRIIILTALAVGSSVAVAGIIGFVGLVVPHLIRLLIGPDHRYLLPAAACIGGMLLLWADLLARTVLSPVELPIGIITALLGGPFFLYLVIKVKPN